MRGPKQRKVVTPIKEQNPSTVVQQHVEQNIHANNVLVAEYDVINKERPISCWKKDLLIPRWLLMTLATLAIVFLTAFILFATIVTLQKQGNGGACKSNSDCRQDVGLICNNYRCGCAYSHFWSTTYDVCERRRMVNRTCVNDSECDILANLQCFNVTLNNGDIQLQCQCKGGLSWNGVACSYQSLYNSSCINTDNCDTTRFLYCDFSAGTPGRCNCNASMFWNANLISGTCEYKRTVNQYCYPYDDSWCDNTAPLGQGLTCAAYSNPYGSEYGVCQCGIYKFYNGTASLGNGYCEPLRDYNHSCSSTSNCDFRKGLICSNNLCTCLSTQNYDSTIVDTGGVFGACTAAATYLDNCTSIIKCSASAGLYCDYTHYASTNTTGVCNCNSSTSFWDGLECASKLSIGGECTTSTECNSGDGLFCSNYTQSLGTCDCDKNHFWNYTCIIKQWYNTTCPSSYVCDDNRGLFCQPTGGSFFLKCDCFNSSFIWDSLYVTNRSHICVLKMGYGASTCFGDLECQDQNYLKCFNGTCLCTYDHYYNGILCTPKLNYTDPCQNSTMCRDFAPVNLVCRAGPTASHALQCLCNITSYWSDCLQACIVSKYRHQACTLTSNCSSNECDVTANLQCINDTVSNQTVSGWCNCTTLQWWNGTYCRNKGTPSWGVNASDLCNATYQCADYNLVSCPLGSSSVESVATCECATTKYWNGITCIDRVLNTQACVAWTTYPVNTTTCLTAAGAGLVCVMGTNWGNGSYSGTCACPTGTTWNSTFYICASPPLLGG
ncbi:unnamed protein product [Adineta steineri]|uniref:EGF-like domain-containing protein n=1 Tax=Adineta steineri TaxID=433720 RepID=A0A814GKB8_9BILA|nr:unnamed protein product [Adineta steineri]CAF3911190.1 unnamed protein product [Adineta steineri]